MRPMFASRCVSTMVACQRMPRSRNVMAALSTWRGDRGVADLLQRVERDVREVGVLHRERVRDGLGSEPRPGVAERFDDRDLHLKDALSAERVDERLGCEVAAEVAERVGRGEAQHLVASATEDLLQRLRRVALAGVADAGDAEHALVGEEAVEEAAEVRDGFRRAGAPISLWTSVRNSSERPVSSSIAMSGWKGRAARRACGRAPWRGDVGPPASRG